MIDEAQLTDAQIAEDAILIGLIERVALNDGAAVNDFYDRTVNRVYGVALRIVRNPRIAEEITSETYLQIWREADRFEKTRGRVLGWLLVIARSRALDAYRKIDPALSHPNPQELCDESTVVHGTLSEELDDLLTASRESTRLKTALLSLSPVQRQLISLAFFKGLTHAEIVQTTEIPLGTVKTHIRRGLIALRDQLNDDILYSDRTAAPMLTKGTSFE
jgi:RNA polymerase sigma factor (sigma-70 family)